ncbi:MAG: endopeptidase La [Eubacterium sp.]|nr:endopeptidase La [Eubacterium sp.]
MEIRKLPLLPLRARVVCPDTAAMFELSSKRSIRTLEEAVSADQMIVLTAQINAVDENPGTDELYRVGTVAKVLQMVKGGQGTLRVFAQGISRVNIHKILNQDGNCLIAEVEDLEPCNIPEGDRETVLFRMMVEYLDDFLSRNPGMTSPGIQKALEDHAFLPLMNEIISNLPFELVRKQEFLEETDAEKQAEMLMIWLQRETRISDLRNEISRKVKVSVDKNQKDYILREQIKVIREELGEADIGSEADEYMERLEKLKASAKVKEKIRKEILRFKAVPGVAAESTVMRNYIETMLEMPWNKASRDNKDLNRAMEILEEDHYGLDKVKDRIMDYLAVRSLTRNPETPILCLVGPPGTGKTSVARSVARAVNKKYVRISLGGVRDEAEIRGHRKTYVGAMPGRIAEGIRAAGVKNPLMLLDEIDKVSSDYKGDTASALLEVLDGEQNVRFRDHFLEVPLDLSEVLFIATANDLAPIAPPLRDRMEIIELSGYTENEKIHIAQKYLIPKQRKASGLKDDQVSLSDEVIRALIHGYTREAGVRSLERNIARLMHKTARRLVEGKETWQITEDHLEDLLGIAPFEEDDAATPPRTGMVRGLAWTSVGGDTLIIEVSTMPGKGKLELTGRMGDVMRESAQIALSYVRSAASAYDVEADYFEKHDIHLHIPEGAVPKDGPSAGITMALAMLSAITGIPVRGDLAMTGEITLRGKVLPVGGLKEKLLAAKNVGITEVLVPGRNSRHIRDLDEEITGDMQIVYVETMDDVIRKAFVEKQQ